MSVWSWSTTAGTNASSDAAIDWAEGMLPSGVNNSARAMMAALKAFIQDTGGVTTAGSSNAYTVSLSQAMASASKGIIGIIADRANTGAATLNVDGLGAYPLRLQTGVALSAGDIVAGGFYIVTWASGTSEWLILTTTMPASNLGNVGEGFRPGGRLTLTSGTPVMTSTASGQTTVYYTPYLGDMVPIWNGTNFVPTRFTELSQTTTDNTKSPAAVTTNSNYDIFVWSDSGTLRATRGPAWSSDTSRGTGAGTTQLSYVRGVLTNTVAITNGPGAGYGTYVGTIRSNGSSQIDFIYGAAASGGTAASLGVWNYYNRVLLSTTVEDNGTNYTYTSATVRSCRASATNRVSFVSGFAEDSAAVAMRLRVATVSGAAGANTTWGIGLDSTSAYTVKLNIAFTPSTNQMIDERTCSINLSPQIGFHYIQACEGGDGTNANTIGTGTSSTLLNVALQM